MSNSSVTSSPARSSNSTAAVAGINAPPSSASGEEFNFPAEMISIQDRKYDALRVLKSDVMATLNEEVKAMDEDNWMFEGPRSRIHLISKPGAKIDHEQMRYTVRECLLPTHVEGSDIPNQETRKKVVVSTNIQVLHNITTLPLQDINCNSLTALQLFGHLRVHPKH